MAKFSAGQKCFAMVGGEKTVVSVLRASDEWEGYYEVAAKEERCALTGKMRTLGVTLPESALEPITNFVAVLFNLMSTDEGRACIKEAFTPR